MTAVIRFGEEITMSDYFVINKYKSEEYTRTHINTATHTQAHTAAHTVAHTQPRGQRCVYAFLLSTLRVAVHCCTQNVY